MSDVGQRPLFVQKPVNVILFYVLGEQRADVDLELDGLLEKRYQKPENVVVHVVIPALNPDSVQRSRIIEILCQVVDDDCSGEVTTQVLQVLDGVVLMRGRMLPVESMADFACSVDVVEDPIGVLFENKGK